MKFVPPVILAGPGMTEVPRHFKYQAPGWLQPGVFLFAAERDQEQVVLQKVSALKKLHFISQG